jgi:hypothetical protein
VTFFVFVFLLSILYNVEKNTNYLLVNDRKQKLAIKSPCLFYIFLLLYRRK